MRKSSKQARMQHRRPARAALAVAICMAISSVALAQDAPAEEPKQPEDKAAGLGTVTVTAQKREENLQKVPISINVLGEQTLEQQNVNSFEEVVRLLPSVSFSTFGPGFGQVYMRGVANGGDGNHSTSLPSVGVYLDEQPVTTIQGPLDIHMYDIARVEALSGPQGTLYGASSEAGTLRIITNKPDPSAFAAGFGVELNSVSQGGTGHVLEGFVNLPISASAALRAVAWQKKDAGFIDNKPGTRTYPTWAADSGTDGTIDNALVASDDYNEVDIVGGRAALRFDLGENWTITPGVMGQSTETGGTFQYDPVVGDLELTHFRPENSDDRWTQASLTVQGRIGNFDLTYAFAHLNRHDEVNSDYSDYALWYDTVYGYGSYWYDDNYDTIEPSQYIEGKDRYRKTSHELRVSSDADQPFRFVAGLFWQDQFHDIEQRYKIDGLGSMLEVTGWSDTLWLTKQERRDHDEAVFGEFTYDFTDSLTATAGFRHFKAHNSLDGFFGFGRGYSGTPVEPDPADYPDGSNDPDYISDLADYLVDAKQAYGEAKCDLLYGENSDDWQRFNGAPCQNLAKEVRESGTLYRANLTYEFDDRHLVYATYSEGYRPGGVQRRGTLPNYRADYLNNWELGWKTSWASNRLILNGAIFREEWKNFQFAVLGQNGLTDIRNAPQAAITGVEMELTWAPTYNLTFNGGFSYYDAKLTKDYCGQIDQATEEIITQCQPGDPNPNGGVFDGPEAPEGTQLPVTARFKANLTGRYTWDIGSMEAHVQGSLLHEGKRESDLRLYERSLIGAMPAYETFDFSIGLRKDKWSVDLFVKNAFDQRGQVGRFYQCSESVCANDVLDTDGGYPVYPPPAGYENGQVYIIPVQPRTAGVRFSMTW
jgi:outer membrane receptor protein involved in Fe transport